MSKIVKLAQAMRERALAEIEKNAARASASAASAEATSVSPAPAATKNDGRFKAKPGVDRGPTVPDVFGDIVVCRFLGKNRAYLVRVRKSHARGEDWDAIGHHCGMTAAWILKENPAADLSKIIERRILPGDGIVSVEVVQHTLDFRKLACKRLSDGQIVVVQVRDATQFRNGDQFDAEECGGVYRYNDALNRI